jgi:hypothetical protein
MTFVGYILLTEDKQICTVFAFSFGAESDLLPLRVVYEYISDRTKDSQEETERFQRLDICHRHSFQLFIF